MDDEEPVLDLKEYQPGQLDEILRRDWNLGNLEELILNEFGRNFSTSKFLGFYNGNELACFDIAMCLVRLHLQYARKRTEYLPMFNIRFVKCVLSSKTLSLLSFFSEGMLDESHNIFLDRSCVFASLQENPTVELMECMRTVMPRRIDAKFKRIKGRERFGLIIYFKKMKPDARFQYIQQYLSEDPSGSTASTESKRCYHHFLKLKTNKMKIRSSILLESAFQTMQFEYFENVSSISLSRKAWNKVFDALSARPSQAAPMNIIARRAICPELTNRELSRVPRHKLKSLYLTTSSTWDEAQLRTSLDLAFQAIISSAYLERVQCIFTDINMDYLPLVKNFLNNTINHISIVKPILDWEIHFPVAEDLDELYYIDQMMDINEGLKHMFHALQRQPEMNAMFRVVCARMIGRYGGQSKIRMLPLVILRGLHSYLI